jgi:hypothetical protein
MVLKRPFSLKLGRTWFALSLKSAPLDFKDKKKPSALTTRRYARPGARRDLVGILGAPSRLTPTTTVGITTTPAPAAATSQRASVGPAVSNEAKNTACCRPDAAQDNRS